MKMGSGYSNEVINHSEHFVETFIDENTQTIKNCTEFDKKKKKKKKNFNFGE